LLADDAARRRTSGEGAGGSSRPGAQELDKAYDDIDHMLEGLKEKSQVINRTLGQHNEMLPGITSKVERDQERLRKQQEQMKKQFR